jgi:molecular chaperone DnaK (HSP70)
MKTQCERCGEFDDCQAFTVHNISLCKSCIELIVAEWKIGNSPKGSGRIHDSGSREVPLTVALEQTKGRASLAFPLGIETIGGVFTALLAKGTRVPVTFKEIFSTMTDGQTSIEVKILQGESHWATANESRGRLHILGISPAPRGVPQIEVQFEIGEDSLMYIKAVDLATGNPKLIRIEAFAKSEQASEHEDLHGTPVAVCTNTVDGQKVLMLSVGLETIGGVFTRVLKRGTKIPVRVSEIFSTAADNQSSVEICLLQGERLLAKDNRTLGRFNLCGIPAAPRGIPQIEVTFEIGEDSLLYVTAKDLATGNLEVTVADAASLSDEDAQAMLDDATAHRKEDKQIEELVDARNSAQSLIHQVESMLRDNEAVVTVAEHNVAIAAVDKSKAAVQSQILATIKRATEELSHVLSQISQTIYGKKKR